MTDLQTEWRPSSFAWVAVHAPPSWRGEWCCCLGPITRVQAAMGLCVCEFEDRFGRVLFVRRLTLPPVRGPAAPLRRG